LFLLAAFLLEPALTFLFDLLFFVTLVLDTMISPLYFKNYSNLFDNFLYRRHFLPIQGQLVKIIILLSFSFLSPNTLSCGNNSIKQQNTKYLGIGEYHQIKLNHLKNYALSNREIISAKLSSTKKTLLIRAKQQGLSTVKVWQKSSQKEFRFIVMTKKLAGELKSVNYSLSALGLDSQIKNGEIKVCNLVENFPQLSIVWKLKQSRKDKIFKLSDHYRFSKTFKKILASKIYSSFIKRKITNVKCTFETLPITCTIPKSKIDLVGIQKFWLKNIPLKLIRVNETLMLPNYRLKTKLILTESANRDILQLGLHKISGKVFSLINKDFNGFIGENQVNINNTKVKLSSMATPEIILRVGSKSQFSIGSEIPFSNKLKDDLYTEWKFAGLKVSALIEKEGDQYFLNIQTELSRPNTSSGTTSITSNRTSSRLNIKLKKTLEVVNISHRGIQNELSSLSYLSRLPILGRLFTSNTEIETFKNIKLYLQLERL